MVRHLYLMTFPLLFLLAASTAMSEMLFDPAVLYPSGWGAQAICVANADSDSDLDLMVANSSTYSRHINNGDGTFQARAYEFSAGCAPYAIEWLYGPCLVASNAGDGAVTVIPPSGCVRSYEVGFQAVDVCVGDFNNDGMRDAATANYYGKSISVLLCYNLFYFNPSTTYSVDEYSWSICTGDFDQDGNADLICTRPQAGDIMTWDGNGDGTFTAGSTYDVGGGGVNL